LYRHISHEKSAVWSCYFTYAQGSGAISPGLGSNAAELKKLDRFITQALNYPALLISRIRLTGYCSIEGSYTRNEVLARERVGEFYAYLCGYYPDLHCSPHDLAWVAEDWDGLSCLVRASRMNEREEILEIIRTVPVCDSDIREALLVKLNGSHAWHFMERKLFPRLRRVELRIEYQSVRPHDAGNAAQPALSSKDAQQALSPELSTLNPPHFALKTNLLLLAGVQSDFKYTTPVNNVALEYYINDHWSVEFSAMYSYWRYNSRREFQGVSGYRLEPRYRHIFPGARLEAYLGLYGRSGDYDLRFAQSATDNAQSAINNEQMTNIGQPTLNYTGDYWDAGASAGLFIRLAGNLGCEVGARAGYVSTNAIKYIRKYDRYLYESERGYRKLRVTDLNLSLIYRF
jgi:hypothetical protein